jgi:hypothetical protein
MGVNQKRHKNSDKKFYLCLCGNPLQFCIAHTDMGKTFLKQDDCTLYTTQNALSLMTKVHVGLRVQTGEQQARKEVCTLPSPGPASPGLAGV